MAEERNLCILLRYMAFQRAQTKSQMSSTLFPRGQETRRSVKSPRHTVPEDNVYSALSQGPDRYFKYSYAVTNNS